MNISTIIESNGMGYGNKRSRNQDGLSRLEKQERDQYSKDLGYFNYQDYLSSPLWEEIRNKTFKEKGCNCSACGDKADVVHHEYYTLEILRGDTLEWLWPLCDDCHQKVHKPGKQFLSLVESAELLRLLISNTKTKKCKKCDKEFSKNNLRRGKCRSCNRDATKMRKQRKRKNYRKNAYFEERKKNNC